MLLRTPDELREEIRALISLREPVARAEIIGKLFFLDKTFADEVERSHSPIIWILRAQVGTLDKLNELFERDGPYQTFELLAIARNLFENLVWLRLFNLDHEYGLIFYEELLKQQIQNTENVIEKIESEIVLFEHYERLDQENLDDLISKVKDKPTEDEMKALGDEHRTLTAELDMQVRRSFALYGAAAQFNSYGYQCHLLREEVLPTHRTTLTEVKDNLDKFSVARKKLLSEPMLAVSKTRWNWKNRAEDVGMLQQYKFLYAYTSKLLHSTPMNLITEKTLSASETLLMLDYAFVAISDMFEELESFTFDGQANVLFVEI